MSSPDFENIIHSSPLDHESQKRLVKLLKEWRSHPSPAGWEFAHVQHEVGNPSAERLALVLNGLVDKGLLKSEVRVVSPTRRGGIEDYPSIADVPDTLYDYLEGVDIAVTPENLRVVYKFLSSYES